MACRLFVAQEMCVDMTKHLSALEPQLDRVSRHTKNFRPLANTFGFAVDRKESGGSQVVRLLLWGGPATIGRLIAAIAVDTVYRVRWRGRIAHVLQKKFVAIPALADLDASSAVNGKFFVVRIIAARSHRRPSAVSLGAFALHTKAMTFWFVDIFFMKAPTGLRVSVSKFAYSDFDLIPAYAKT
jgi:hypothetical protein